LFRTLALTLLAAAMSSRSNRTLSARDCLASSITRAALPEKWSLELSQEGGNGLDSVGSASRLQMVFHNRSAALAFALAFAFALALPAPLLVPK